MRIANLSGRLVLITADPATLRRRQHHHLTPHRTGS